MNAGNTIVPDAAAGLEMGTNTRGGVGSEVDKQEATPCKQDCERVKGDVAEALVRSRANTDDDGDGGEGREREGACRREARWNALGCC